MGYWQARNGQVMDTVVIQVVYYDRDRTGAVTDADPDTSGLVGYIEYLAVPVDKEGNITEPVYISYWCSDDYKGFTSGYIITASSVLSDGTLIHEDGAADRISAPISKTCFKSVYVMVYDVRIKTKIK